MNSLLIIGAGRSSSFLISYLLKEAVKNNWTLTVGDFIKSAAEERIEGYPMAQAIAFDITDASASADAIAKADVIVSLLPASLHVHVARICLEKKKHLLHASYVSGEMKAMHEEAKAKGLLFLNECGLDPGIDHMSAMQVIDQIGEAGGKMISFESFTGGLIAPETDPENPWRYKFTWNARNVVTAGQSTAKYLQQGEFKYIPYQQLFRRITPVAVPGYGEYEGYANRDSLTYMATYKLQGIETMLRGTLRNKGYCSAWNVLVQLGCCDDTYEMDNVSEMTHLGFISSFLESDPALTAEQRIAKQFSLSWNAPEIERLKWSGFFEREPIGLAKGTPAQILEHILNKKWKLHAGDKDLVVMWHRFVYEQEGRRSEIQSTLVAKGEDAVRTAMAKTVGLPLAIATKLLMQDKIKLRGVVLPVHKEIYQPILAELKALGVELIERQV